MFTIAGLAHVARITFANMAGPVRSAFAMEILDPTERGTQIGIEMALSSALAGLSSYFMAGFMLVSTLLFWWFFSGQETILQSSPMPDMMATGD